MDLRLLLLVYYQMCTVIFTLFIGAMRETKPMTEFKCRFETFYILAAALSTVDFNY